MNNHIVYAYAKVESWLLNYAEKNNLRALELTTNVADMLATGSINEATPVVKKVGRPKLMLASTPGIGKSAPNPNSVHPAKAYWAKLTPEQRRTEMARRMKVRLKKAKQRQPMGGVA